MFFSSIRSISITKTNGRKKKNEKKKNEKKTTKKTKKENKNENKNENEKNKKSVAHFLEFRLCAFQLGPQVRQRRRCLLRPRRRRLLCCGVRGLRCSGGGDSFL